jgi:hypothetical protein
MALTDFYASVPDLTWGFTGSLLQCTSIDNSAFGLAHFMGGRRGAVNYIYLAGAVESGARLTLELAIPGRPDLAEGARAALLPNWSPKGPPGPAASLEGSPVYTVLDFFSFGGLVFLVALQTSDGIVLAYPEIVYST